MLTFCYLLGVGVLGEYKNLTLPNAYEVTTVLMCIFMHVLRMYL